MSRAEHLSRRLAVALREREDAERVWRATMELDTAVADEAGAIATARRVDAVWQERELARARVVELQRRLAAATSRRSLSRAWYARR